MRNYFGMESDVERECNNCGEMHVVFYKEYSNGSKHLTCACKENSPVTTLLPFEEGLDIPTICT